MTRRFILASALALSLVLPGCSSVGGGGDFGVSPFALVRATPRKVADGSLTVTPPRPWNRMRPALFVDIRQVEDWTQNGPILDSMSFVAGLKDNRTLVRQYRRDDRQVPYFRADMTPPEIAAMLESFFRVRTGTIDYRTLALAPRPFLGRDGFQLDFEHLDSDELWRRGRAVGTVVNGRLYLVLLDAAKSHYFDATLPDFEAVVASARLG